MVLVHSYKLRLSRPSEQLFQISVFNMTYTFKNFLCFFDLKTGGIAIAVIGMIASVIQIIATIAFVAQKVLSNKPQTYKIEFYFFVGLASPLLNGMYFYACHQLFKGARSVSWYANTKSKFYSQTTTGRRFQDQIFSGGSTLLHHLLVGRCLHSLWFLVWCHLSRLRLDVRLFTLRCCTDGISRRIEHSFLKIKATSRFVR